MMYHKESEKTYHVMCICGQMYPVVKPDLLPILTCGVCGRQIKVTPESLLPPEESNTALFRRMKEQAPMDRILECVRLVKEGRYELAKPIFHSVVAEVAPLREAFYGLGYCCYRDHEYFEALIYVGIAVLLGHPHAETLFKKLQTILNIPDLSIKKM